MMVLPEMPGQPDQATPVSFGAGLVVGEGPAPPFPKDPSFDELMQTDDWRPPFAMTVTCVSLELVRMTTKLPHCMVWGVNPSCLRELTGRKMRYCSQTCADWWTSNHDWTAAREEALQRARFMCAHCRLSDAERVLIPFRSFDRAAGEYVVTRIEQRWKQRDPWAFRFEVNHIVPLRGTYRAKTCLNHQANLEVLCRDCHRIVTTAQRRGEC